MKSRHFHLPANSSNKRPDGPTPTTMVLLRVKSALAGGGGSSSSSPDEFLYEAPSSTAIDDLIRDLVELRAARLRSCLVVDAARGLAEHGPMKKPEEAGTDQVRLSDGVAVAAESTIVLADVRRRPLPSFFFDPAFLGGIFENRSPGGAVPRLCRPRQVQELLGKDVEKGPNYNPDPSGLRTGNPPDPHYAEILKREADALEEYVGKANRDPLRIEAMREKTDGVRGAATMAYPEGLPEWDAARIALDGGAEELLGTHLGGALAAEPDRVSLWACGKEFERGTLLSDRLGRNEKTKITVKLTDLDAGAPAREPVVSEAEREAMTAFYFKRQEELKKLADADEDDYLNSEWADPKGMRRGLQGLGDVKAPGLRF
ncbi:hypothetical protein ACHAWF_001974 [Thalassiosira exigua]